MPHLMDVAPEEMLTKQKAPGDPGRPNGRRQQRKSSSGFCRKTQEQEGYERYRE